MDLVRYGYCSCKKMHIERRVGGAYQLFMSVEDAEPSNSGTFSIFKKNARVVYDWEWYNDGEITEISVEFLPESDGTRIALSHTGFTKQQSRDMHDDGWDSYIKGFEDHLANLSRRSQT